MGNANKIILTIRYVKHQKRSKEKEFEPEISEFNQPVQEKSLEKGKEVIPPIPMPDLSVNESIETKQKEFQEIKNLLEEENEKPISETQLQSNQTIQAKTEIRETIPPQFNEVFEKAKELDPILQKTSLFLDEEIDEKTEKNLYSLDHEFAKTRKNKNLFSYLILIGFILILGGLTYALTYEIRQKSNQSQLEIKEFEDLNLSEAINKARETEKKLGNLKEELENSKKNFNSQMDLIRLQTEEKMKGILGQKLSEKEKQKLIDALKKQEQEQIYQAKLVHESEIRKKEKQINDIQFQLADYQKKYEAKMREKEQSFGDERKLFETQIKKQKEAYEAKISDLTAENEKLKLNTKEYHQKLIDDLREEYEEKIKNLKQTSLKELEENSIQTAQKIKILEDKTQGLSNNLKSLEEKNKSLEEQNQNLVQELNKKNQALESVQYAINTFAQSKRENGYVLDPRDFSRIIVIINNNYMVKDGDTGIIIDDEDKKVADVEFFVEKNYTRAVVKGDTKNLTIKPFYRLIINLK